MLRKCLNLKDALIKSTKEGAHTGEGAIRGRGGSTSERLIKASQVQLTQATIGKEMRNTLLLRLQWHALQQHFQKQSQIVKQLSRSALEHSINIYRSKEVQITDSKCTSTPLDATRCRLDRHASAAMWRPCPNREQPCKGSSSHLLRYECNSKPSISLYSYYWMVLATSTG